MSISILVIDDSADDRDILSRMFEARGHTVRTAASASEARIALAEHTPDAAILSLPLPDAIYSNLAVALMDDEPDLGLILLVEAGGQLDLMDAIRRGAICLEKPADPETLAVLADRVAAFGRQRDALAVRRRDDMAARPESLLPPAVAMQVDLAARNADAPVLIVGERGTEKSSLARLIHESSSRARAPFFELHCTTTSQTTLERRLFGNERGAAAGARDAKRGILELADGGSVLLTSIPSMPYESQALLLRYVEEGVFRRGGGNTELRSNARIITTAAKPLAPSVDAGLFRADLFYRLQVLTIAVPPLRDRTDEIEDLVRPLLPPGVELSPAATLALQQHSWPGNMRELRNAIWRAALLAGRGAIAVHHLPLSASLEAHDVGKSSGGGDVPPLLALQELERRAILTALQRTGGNKLKAAALLGIARSTLHDKLKKL